MPWSQTIYRKQCLLHFELRGCTVSKKREKPSYVTDILTVAFRFANPHLNLEAFILNVGSFHLWPSAQKSQQNFFGKPSSWEAALLKPVLEGDHSEGGLSLVLWVQTLLGPALCEMINCYYFPMCNHHHCQGLQNLRTSKADSCGWWSASQKCVRVNAQVKSWASTFL